MNASDANNVFVHVDRVASTHEFLASASKFLKKYQSTVVLAADSQYSGIGQHDKVWYKEDGAGISFSILLRDLGIPLQDYFAVHLLVTQAIQGALSTFHPDIPLRFKWPNDLVLHDRKLGGILIHNTILKGQIVESLIGVGVNTTPLSSTAAHLDHSSLSELNDKIQDPMVYTQLLADHIDKGFHASSPQSIQQAFQAYNRNLWKREQGITIIQDNNTLLATLIAVTREGDLLVSAKNKRKTLQYHNTRWQWK